MACGGGFPLFSPCASSRYVTGQPKFVANGGLVPEMKAASSCSLKCNCLEGLTEGSTRCETSSRYWDEGATFGSYGDPSSSAFAAGEKLVLDLVKGTSNSTFTMREAFKTGSWARQKPAAVPAYIDLTTCRNQNLPLHSPDGQRTLRGTGINPTLMESSQEFKPDDASSHNMLSKSSGDLEILSESINECLMKEDRANARPREADHMQMAMKGSTKRKAAELMKKPAGVEVQSERKTQEESRIVRVSRLTGGKDRHSKVRTAKGLRDRRVRLSVSTAIQFYDLQDRLGYEQPSLAVDWLLKAAQPFIAELPQPDKDDNSLSVSAPVVDAGSNLASTNCSPVKCRESATAPAGAKAEIKLRKKELTMEPSKHSEAGKSSSSASDGSIMGAEYTSKSPLSKSARLKEARERFKRKSASAKIPAASPQASSLESSFPGQFVNKDESSYGISNQISGDHTQHQLWDCGTQLSYADILCKDTRQLQHMGYLGTSSTAVLQQAMQPGKRSCDEMADSGITCIDTKQKNAVQLFFNRMHTYPPQQHQSQSMQKHFASSFVNASSNDANFSTPGFCTTRGPLQSNLSSCITNYSPLHAQRNAYVEATRPNVLPVHPYDSRIPEWFSYTLDGNVNNEATH